MRPFRFGLQLTTGGLDELVARARDAEAAGFDLLCVGDHVGPYWEPLVLLTHLAAHTERVRLATLVLNGDLYDPVLLARQAVALDHASGGRFELGIGAGHTWHEYEAIGRPFDPPAVRKRRLCEKIDILRDLLAGKEVSYLGAHHEVHSAQVMAPVQRRIPILVAGNGRTILEHAARCADAIGLSGLGRTLADGHNHEVRWAPERLDAQVELIRRAAGDRFAEIELNALVQMVVVTTDREAAAVEIAAETTGLTVADALATPFLALGTHEEIAQQLLDARARFGITSYVTRDLDAFAPVVALLHGR